MENLHAAGRVGDPSGLWTPAAALLERGGAAMAAILALSVLLVAVAMWKFWRLAVTGAFARRRAEAALAHWQGGDHDAARAMVADRRNPRTRVLAAGFDAVTRLPADRAAEETARVARRELAQAASGLRVLELVSLIAPLLGLLGTVLGMIGAFRALEASGGAADPATLAGGIWEALLTTAAGMGVAIPALLLLGVFEAVVDRLRLDLQDLATRVLAAPGDGPAALPRAAE